MKTIKITRVETALDMIPVWEELGQLMDQVNYQRREGHNVVVLVKELVNG